MACTWPTFAVARRSSPSRALPASSVTVNEIELDGSLVRMSSAGLALKAMRARVLGTTSTGNVAEISLPDSRRARKRNSAPVTARSGVT